MMMADQQWEISLRDGTQVVIRPIRPQDEPLVAGFHEGLFDQTVIYRYFHVMTLGSRTTHERLIHICSDEGGRETVLVVESRRAGSDEPFIMGIGRLSKSNDMKEAELALVVADAWQNRGLGSQLLKLLLECASDAGIEEVNALIMSENLEMVRLVEKFGFKLVRDPIEPTITATLHPDAIKTSNIMIVS